MGDRKQPTPPPVDQTKPQPPPAPPPKRGQDVILDLDALMNAVAREWELPKRLDADARWVQAFLASRMADLLAQVSTGVRLAKLPPLDRAWLKGQAEQLVADAVEKFRQPAGDAEYKPEDEPEFAHDLDFDGLTGHGRF